MSTLKKKSLVIGWLAPALWLAGSLAILSAISRMVITSQALLTGTPPPDPTDTHYVEHAWLTAVHIVPGTLFLLLGPLQFISSIRVRWSKMHRYSGRVFVVSGLIVAVTAIMVNMVFPPSGGLSKSLAVLVISTELFIALLISLRAILNRNIVTHRVWMIRAFAAGLSLSTMRLFFIPAYYLYGMPSDFTIGLVMWVGFLVNTFVAEYILWRERNKNIVKI